MGSSCSCAPRIQQGIAKEAGDVEFVGVHGRLPLSRPPVITGKALADVEDWFIKIDDHSRQLMLPIDPHKVTLLKDEAASKATPSK